MKTWLIMIYANGNNDLEAENYEILKQFSTPPFLDNASIVIQIGREEKKYQAFLHPQEKPFEKHWSGGRTYSIENHSIKLLQKQNSNMADPKQLYEFIVNCIYQHPAKRKMLIVGGHIYQFVGMLPDYCHDLPYFMPFPEMAHSISKALALCQVDLDLLILDTCYASTIEILCEFNWKQCRIKKFLSYAGAGPGAGMDYHLFKNSFFHAPHDMDVMICEFLEKSEKMYHYPYVYLELKYQHLLELKQLFHLLAKSQINISDTTKKLSPYELLQNPSEENKIIVLLIQYLTKNMIIYFTPQNHDFLPISVLYEIIPDQQRVDFYSRLNFAQDNFWLDLLCKTTISPQKKKYEITENPEAMDEHLLSIFLKSGLTECSETEKKKKIKTYCNAKNWKFL